MSILRRLTRVSRRRVLLTVAFVALVFVLQQIHRGNGDEFQHISTSQSQHEGLATVDIDTLEILQVSGFENVHSEVAANCSMLQADQHEVRIAKSRYLDDDLFSIAEQIIHPMVIYPDEYKHASLAVKVDKTWGRMAGSSVWLEDQQIYFVASRVFFYTKGIKAWPIISFLRAQIYDENWNHLSDYRLYWRDKVLSFPCMLDIPVSYMADGGFYGPEDPRIIIETGIQDAEPIIIFNMVDEAKATAWAVTRHQYIHRPFSNRTITLQVPDIEQKQAEKNWSPFFVPQPHVQGTSVSRKESIHLHFVYEWQPLTILRCHLTSGVCQVVYAEDKTRTGEIHFESSGPNGHHVSLRGGTNLMPIALDSQLRLTTFIGFPRVHIDDVCRGQAFYRPVITVLSTNGTHFYLDYASDTLDFGHAVLTQSQLDDPCDAGRILIANGIARFDDSWDHDVMTVLLTVADSTVQVAELYGMRAFVETMRREKAGSSLVQQELSPHQLGASQDLVTCSLQSADEKVAAWGLASHM